MKLNPRSINVLVPLGFLLAAAPLVYAILSTHAMIGELARTTAATVSYGARAARDTQTLLEQLTALERNARQYNVLRDRALLTLLQERNARIAELLGALNGQIDDPLPAIVRLREDLAAVVARVADDPGPGPLTEFDRLHAEARALTAQLNRAVADRVERDMAHLTATRASLLHQAIVLIAVALLFGLLFTVLIVRPVRGLGHAIRQLGRGDMDAPIKVRGPADLEHLGRLLDRLRVMLAEVEREKSMFLRHVSHELKTPLSNIREGAELLRDRSPGPLNETQDDIVEILRVNSITLQKSIENLLNFSAWRDQTTRMVRERHDVRTMVEHALASHRLTMQRQRVAVDLDVRCTAWWVDREKMQALLDNLLSNAVKFSPDGGVVAIRVSDHDDTVRLEVLDDGPGIPAAERERVFDAFFQGGGPQHGHVKGTGIGLSVVRECARMHDGSVEVVYGEHAGGHLRVTLPNAAAG